MTVKIFYLFVLNAYWQPKCLIKYLKIKYKLYWLFKNFKRLTVPFSGFAPNLSLNMRTKLILTVHENIFSHCYLCLFYVLTKSLICIKVVSLKKIKKNVCIVYTVVSRETKNETLIYCNFKSYCLVYSLKSNPSKK